MRICTIGTFILTLMAVNMAAADSTGCDIERFAVEEGVNQYQYDSFSSDGNQIAIAWDRGEDSRDTYLLDIQTRERSDIPALNNGATFSPDGKHLLNSVYVDNGKTDIALYEMATGESTILAPHDEWDWLPSFSPNGSSVVFNSFRTGNSDIYLLELKDGSLRQLISGANYEAHAQFSPDGNSVLFHEQVSETDFNIKRIDLSTGATYVLSDATSEESYGSWSPDGKYIAFASDRDQQPGVTDIFIMDREGSVLRKITDSPAKDAYPFWSPDGLHLYFTSSRQPQGVYRIRMSDFINCRRAP